MQLQVDQHAPRAGARDVAVQCQSCFWLERFSSSASLRSFAVRFLRDAHQWYASAAAAAADAFPHRRRCWARQRLMLIANMAPAMSTPSATPTRNMGSAGAERTIFVGSSVSFWAACASSMMLENIGPARYGSVKAARMWVRVGGCLRPPGWPPAGLNFVQGPDLKGKRSLRAGKTLPHETRARVKRCARAARAPTAQTAAGAAMKATYGALDDADDDDGRVPPTTLRANKLCWTVETNSIKRELLSDVSARFSPGTITALVGPSGAGKASLLMALAGRLQGDHRGAILVNDVAATASGGAASRR